jgi:hypothetical protein
LADEPGLAHVIDAERIREGDPWGWIGLVPRRHVDRGKRHVFDDVRM